MIVMRQLVKDWMHVAIEKLQQDGVLPQENEEARLPEVIIEPTKDESHGDFATNFALAAAKLAKLNPRELANKLIEILTAQDLVEKIEVAGPGFINFFLAKKAFYQIILDIHKHSKDYGKTNIGQDRKIHLEFVSANPTGPLHVGHGRHAAFGACVANLLEHIGYKVHREYYVNDAGRQMNILALSLWLRYLELVSEYSQTKSKIKFPNKAYQGSYVIDIAKLLNTQEHAKLATDEVVNSFNSKLKVYLAEKNITDNDEQGDLFVDLYVKTAKEALGELNFKTCLDLVTNSVLTDIVEDLAEFGVHYDNWFSEGQMVAEGAVPKTIEYLKNKDYLYEKDEAIWFRTSDLGDEKDRVLIRSNGMHTYFAPDIAYHLNKLERGFDTIIDILGSDHHGYVPRLRACLRAFDKPDDKFVTKLVQFVHLYRGTEKVQMSTRSGSFITLRELRNEVGNDAARFFYVMRRVDQIVDFDIELAKSKSQENPVYYIQYAHARICSVMRQLKEKGFNNDLDNLQDNLEDNLSKLIEPMEMALLKHLAKYLDFIQAAALAYEPHRMVQYVRDLAHLFHKYYNAHMILVDDENLRNARISLILAVKQVIANTLALLGVSSPEEM